MKRIDFRQDKLVHNTARMKKSKKPSGSPEGTPQAQEGLQEAVRGGAVFGLVSNILMASKIAQSAKHHHLGVHNFDKAKPLIEHAEQKPPALIIMDWDGCEAEAFRVLKALKDKEGLKGVPTVGFVSQAKAQLKAEGERAGCHRMYSKSEFPRILDELMVRYAI